MNPPQVILIAAAIAAVILAAVTAAAYEGATAFFLTGYYAIMATLSVAGVQAFKPNPKKQ